MHVKFKKVPDDDEFSHFRVGDVVECVAVECIAQFNKNPWYLIPNERGATSEDDGGFFSAIYGSTNRITYIKGQMTDYFGGPYSWLHDVYVDVVGTMPVTNKEAKSFLLENNY